METLIKTQEHLDRLIAHTAMIGNIYHDKEMNYIPINWENEYIKMVNDNGKTTIERIPYVA
jgi:hypothetical protein